MSASSSRVKWLSMFVGIIAAAKRISKMIVKVVMSDSLIATSFVSILHLLKQKLPRQWRSFVTGQVGSSIVSRFLEMQRVCQFSTEEVYLVEASRPYHLHYLFTTLEMRVEYNFGHRYATF